VHCGYPASPSIKESAMRLLSCLAGAVLTVAATLAHAAAPQQKGQAPGWYRMQLGAFEITALSDGTFEMKPEELLTGTTPAKVKAALGKAGLQSPIEASVNGFLINTGAKLVLIDAGAAGLFGPTLGRLPANLKAAGYTPEQVDEVYITHMHGDHVGGLATPDGKAVFPNAVVRADVKEGGFWLDPATLEKAPAAMKDFVKGAQISLKPYVDAGRFKPFEGAVELVPGIRSLPTHGHTPGHAAYVAESNGRKMVFWGDLMHVAAVQFPDPSVTIQFDSDSKAAMPQRKKAFADAARGGYYAAAAHVSFPGIGRLRPDGKGYRWLPVNYTANAAK
jgi:glyoxylase-like metal-dependent hydrolase (beta-lactamase superfamily II)